MKSVLPEKPVAITGLPSAIASASVEAEALARCSET